MREEAVLVAARLKDEVTMEKTPKEKYQCTQQQEGKNRTWSPVNTP